ncbi:MAG TPA: hypothetical protein VF585_07400 [Chthoniobacterales bacterium]|jgi:hypothetical protein
MTASISNLLVPFSAYKTRLLMVLLAGWLASEKLVSAQSSSGTKKKANPTGTIVPTALAETATAEVKPGGEVVVHLRGISRSGGQMEFRLQQKPAHGMIMSSKQVAADRLEVVYRHSGDPSDKDSFVFAVRAGGSGPFSPGEAKITVKRDTAVAQGSPSPAAPPARLMVPELLNFPATLTGQSAEQSFVAFNEGDKALSGKITLPAAWRLKEASSYRLSPREKRKFTVIFSPQTAGPIEGSLVMEGTPATRISLHGEGLGTFLASPPKLKLTASPDGKRIGTISLQNNTSGEITIAILSEFSLPKAVTLRFGETRELTIEDSGTQRLNSQVTFQSGVFTMKVEVTAGEPTTGVISP